MGAKPPADSTLFQMNRPHYKLFFTCWLSACMLLVTLSACQSQSTKPVNPPKPDHDPKPGKAVTGNIIADSFLPDQLRAFRNKHLGHK